MKKYEKIIDIKKLLFSYKDYFSSGLIFKPSSAGSNFGWNSNKSDNSLVNLSESIEIKNPSLVKKKIAVLKKAGKESLAIVSGHII